MIATHYPLALFLRFVIPSITTSLHAPRVDLLEVDQGRRVDLESHRMPSAKRFTFGLGTVRTTGTNPGCVMAAGKT